jgi:tripartite-type tricarboxylate transporter receptor subunit TctC
MAKLYLKLALTALIAFLTAVPGMAEQWPARPVKIVVPYAAGGGSDTVARILAERLSAAFGQQFYVENRTGANGTIAADYVAHSPADGYTLFMAVSSQIAIAPAVMEVHYDPIKHFTPITAVITNNLALVTSKAIPATNLTEFIEYARHQQRPLAYSSGGVGSVTNLGMEIFLNRAELKMTHVPYKGGNPALAAVIANQVCCMLAVLSDTLGQIRSGEIRLLAIAGHERASQAPDVPTFEEQGYRGFEIKSWNGLMAPAGAPHEIVEKLSLATAKALSDRKLAERLRSFGADPISTSPEQFAAMIKSDIDLWRGAAKIGGIARH